MHHLLLLNSILYFANEEEQHLRAALCTLFPQIHVHTNVLESPEFWSLLSITRRNRLETVSWKVRTLVLGVKKDREIPRWAS